MSSVFSSNITVLRPEHFVPQPINMRQQVGDFEISASFDDSAGALRNLSRGDIRVYDLRENIDVTERISSSIIPANIENLEMCRKWCEENSQKENQNA